MGLFDKAREMAKSAALDVAQRAVDAASNAVNQAKGEMQATDWIDWARKRRQARRSGFDPDIVLPPAEEDSYQPFDDDQIRALEERHRREAREAMYRDLMPMSIELPTYDLSDATFPFGPREYVTLTIPHRDETTQKVLYKEKRYLADDEALAETCKAISLLEFISEQALISVQAIPVLKTDLKALQPVRDCEDIPPEHFVYMRVNPLTPTGRLPKYPISISFDAYEGVESGSHGSIDFLPDGTPAKADISYWINRSGYRASFRLENGGPVLTLLMSLGYTNTVVYRRPKAAV